MNAIIHTHARAFSEQATETMPNGFLECKIQPKNAHRTRTLQPTALHSSVETQ
jgi:hypothetical protein